MQESLRKIGGDAGERSTKDETTYARRNFLVRIIAVMQAFIGGTLAFVLGGSILAPAFARRRETWFVAGDVNDLLDDEPVPVAIRVARDDGYAQIVDRHVLFLVKDRAANVIALSSTCTHLGCRVSWAAEQKELRCPCHGGVFTGAGEVKAGPPPAPLAKLPTRIDGDRVLVQI